MSSEGVLITGTTSGVGLALLQHYYELGESIVCINRRRDAALESRFPKASFHVADISSGSEVLELVKSLQTSGKCPQLFYLNAGINRVDNDGSFSLSTFEDVMRTNLSGCLSFVQAVQKLGVAGRTLIGISSTTVLVPNQKNLGYYASKLALSETFRLLSLSDSSNRYKTVLLGPARTNLARDLPRQTGIQARIFNLLSVQPEWLAKKCEKFAVSNKKVLYPPLMTALFYVLLRGLLKIFPRVYYR